MPRCKGLRWQLSQIRKQEVVVLRTWDLPGWGSSEAGGGPGVGLLGGVGRDRARAEGWCGRGQAGAGLREAWMQPSLRGQGSEAAPGGLGQVAPRGLEVRWTWRETWTKSWRPQPRKRWGN